MKEEAVVKFLPIFIVDAEAEEELTAGNNIPASYTAAKTDPT